MPPTPGPSVRVVVRLPYNRPDNPPSDPQPIEWTQEKADILWKVIERSRSSDSGGADWKGLAAHLEVPLPYILYRVHTRFQEEIKGLKDIQGALSPSAASQATKSFGELATTGDKPSSVSGRAGIRINTGGSTAKLSSSSRNITPLGVRARLNSLTNNPPRPKKTTSSSTLTVQAGKKHHASLRPTTPSSSEGDTDSEDEDILKEEDAERTAEEQDALDRKLQDLQRMMTSETLGLVSSPRTPGDKGKRADRGRLGIITPGSINGSYRRDNLSSQSVSSRSASQSISSAGSPHGSIPDMPSPPLESQSPIRRHMSPTKSSSPPAVSPRSALSHSHRRYGPLVDRSSEPGSSHGSEASSFSDLSDASLSASALESALMSNIRGGGSRLSHFARSRLVGSRSRNSGIPH